MEERRLEVFRAVAQELNFTRAALALHLSQSAVSQHVAALEAELGGRLFERSRRRVSLTAEGAALAQRVEPMLALMAEARRAVAAARGAVAGELRVAASLTVGSYLLPGPLAALGRRHPGLRLHVEIENTENVVHALLSGAADVGFVEDDVEHPGIELTPLFEDELVIVASPEHRFAAQAEVALDELAVEPIVLRERGSGTRNVAEQHLRAAGLRPETLHVVAELTGIEAIKAAVAGRLGVAILSRATLAHELARGTLIARPAEGTPIRRQIARASAVGATVLPAARELTVLLRVSGEPVGEPPSPVPRMRHRPQ